MANPDWKETVQNDVVLCRKGLPVQHMPTGVGQKADTHSATEAGKAQSKDPCALSLKGINFHPVSSEFDSFDAHATLPSSIVL